MTSSHSSFGNSGELSTRGAALAFGLRVFFRRSLAVTQLGHSPHKRHTTLLSSQQSSGSFSQNIDRSRNR